MPSSAVLDTGDPRWGRFVAAHPDALPYHHPSWAATLAACYGFRPFVVAVVGRAGEIEAGLPVMEVAHRPRGRARWVALPFTDRCPALGRGRRARRGARPRTRQGDGRGALGASRAQSACPRRAARARARSRPGRGRAGFHRSRCSAASSARARGRDGARRASEDDLTETSTRCTCGRGDGSAHRCSRGASSAPLAARARRGPRHALLAEPTARRGRAVFLAAGDHGRLQVRRLRRARLGAAGRTMRSADAIARLRGGPRRSTSAAPTSPTRASGSSSSAGARTRSSSCTAPSAERCMRPCGRREPALSHAAFCRRRRPGSAGPPASSTATRHEDLDRRRQPAAGAVPRPVRRRLPRGWRRRRRHGARLRRDGRAAARTRRRRTDGRPPLRSVRVAQARRDARPGRRARGVSAPRGRPDALLCASRSGAIAAAALRIPSFVLADYEHASVGVYRLTGTVFLHPESVDNGTWIARGLQPDRLVSFRGIKEDVSFGGVDIDAVPAHPLGGEGLVRVLLRPPAKDSHYYAPESRTLTLALLERLAAREDVQLVFAPRYPRRSARISRASPGATSRSSSGSRSRSCRC